jgi:DNA-directed RNA polymerase specialized sigma subunit
MVSANKTLSKSKSSDAKSEQLWTKYLAQRNDKDRNALVEHYMPLVRSQSRVMASKMPAQAILDSDDLMIRELLVLWRQLTTLIPKEGNALSHFALGV